MLRKLFKSLDDIPGVNITSAEHQAFTNAWRAAFPYSNQGGHIASQTAQILAAAQKNIRRQFCIPEGNHPAAVVALRAGWRDGGDVRVVKIDLRIMFQEDAKSALLETGVFSSDELSGVVLELDSLSERLSDFLQATRDSSGSWFNPLMKFTRKEFDHSAFFQLECRKTLEESDADYEWNNSAVESLELMKTSAGMEIKLPDRVAISRVAPLKPNMVACVGQWLREYVVHADVAATFSEEGFSGFSLRPVFNSKTKSAHADVHQLYSTAIMPPAEIDRTTPPADGGGIRQLGCFIYDDLKQHNPADFNRTAEDWASLNMPLWVVSARVRDCYMRNKFKGWAFRPVLSKGSELHRKYEDLWDTLFEQISINPQNFF